MTSRQTIHLHRFDNGLVLLAEPMEWLESAAFMFLVPAGCAQEPEERRGLASLTCELMLRGCGQLDSRALVEALDNLGIDRSEGVLNWHASYGGALPADRLGEALAIYADLLRRPHLPAEKLEECRALCLHQLRALEDDPAQRVLVELRERHYPAPFGRSPQGTEPSLRRIELQDVWSFFERYYQPDGTILAVAGRVRWAELRDQVGQLFADWPARPVPQPQPRRAERGQHHIPEDSAQTHMAVAFPCVPYRHPDYFKARGAVGVLSDGLSSRLFTEVREKRGLCYAVHAAIDSLRDEASVVCYAGTSSDRAQETLDVLIAELVRLADGISEEELQRLKVQVRSGLVMQQESSRARAAAIATDWYHLGHVRTLDQLEQIVRQLTVADINAYLAENPPKDFTVVTIGRAPLKFKPRL